MGFDGPLIQFAENPIGLESSWASLLQLQALSPPTSQNIIFPFLFHSNVGNFIGELSSFSQGFLVGPGKLLFFISAHFCGSLFFIFAPLGVRKLLFPFVSSFPLFSSEVLKIETGKKNRNFPVLKNGNFPKLKQETFLKWKIETY